MTDNTKQKGSWFLSVVEKLGGGIGKFIGHIFAAAQDSFKLVLFTVLPFMAFVAILITFVNETGLGHGIAVVLTPLGDSLIGLLVLGLICSFPLIAPILSPGAAVAQVVGVTVGTLIGSGVIPPIYALPALFAINVQVATDSIPVMLSMQDAKPRTIQIGVPSILFSRQITGPIAVLVGYIFSIGLF